MIVFTPTSHRKPFFGQTVPVIGGRTVAGAFTTAAAVVAGTGTLVPAFSVAGAFTTAAAVVAGIVQLKKSVAVTLRYRLGAAKELSLTWRQGQVIDFQLSYAIRGQSPRETAVHYALATHEPAVKETRLIYRLKASREIAVGYACRGVYATSRFLHYEWLARIGQERRITYAIRAAAGVDLHYELQTRQGKEIGLVCRNPVTYPKAATLRYTLCAREPSAKEWRLSYRLIAVQPMITTGQMRIRL